MQLGLIILRVTSLEEVNSFPYLDSIVIKEGGTNENIKIRIQKSKSSF
jgi:hypothetical protein